MALTCGLNCLVSVTSVATFTVLCLHIHQSAQMSVVRALIKAHGEDYIRMARDLKLNKMQHTPAVLKVCSEPLPCLFACDTRAHGFGSHSRSSLPQFLSN